MNYMTSMLDLNTIVPTTSCIEASEKWWVGGGFAHKFRWERFPGWYDLLMIRRGKVK